MITTILFDLDGTLLPMDQEQFVRAYLSSMARKMAPLGYDPDTLVKAVWAGTAAMVKNNSDYTNEQVFWQVFEQLLGEVADKSPFDEFYAVDFPLLQDQCGFNPLAAQTIAEIKALGYRTVLATNPLFPAVATHCRAGWAGLKPEDFALITTYENSSRCKPNPDYYREILGKLNLNPGECLMVGNDVDEDMIASQIGMAVFLLTDCLINRSGQDISRYHSGSFPELLAYIRSLS